MEEVETAQWFFLHYLPTKRLPCEIWGSSLKGCDPVWISKQLPTLLRLLDPEDKALRYFEMPVNIYQSTRRNIPEFLNLRTLPHYTHLQNIADKVKVKVSLFLSSALWRCKSSNSVNSVTHVSDGQRWSVPCSGRFITVSRILLLQSWRPDLSVLDCSVAVGVSPDTTVVELRGVTPLIHKFYIGHKFESVPSTFNSLNLFS